MSRKLIIDTDVGFDDTRALILVLSNCERLNIEVLAITTVFGNVDVNQATVNARRVLKLCEQEQIPVYRGSNGPSTVDTRAPHHHPYVVHGHDGMGDKPDVEPAYSSLKQGGPTDDRPAAVALCKLVAQHPGQVTILALGPLTNLAVAMALDSTFSQNLAELYVMGGNVWGIGNVTHTSEANFFCDPEAADTVMRGVTCPITIAPWDLCVGFGPSAYNANTDYQPYIRSQPSRIGKFLMEISEHTMAFTEALGKPLIYIDEIAAAALIDPETVLETVDKPVRVQTLGAPETRGQMLVQWRHTGPSNTRTIIKYDSERVSDLFRDL